MFKLVLSFFFCRNWRSPRRWGPTRRLHSHTILFEVPWVPSWPHCQHWPRASCSHHHVTPGPISSKVPTQQSSWTLNGPWKSSKGNNNLNHFDSWLDLTHFDSSFLPPIGLFSLIFDTLLISGPMVRTSLLDPRRVFRKWKLWTRWTFTEPEVQDPRNNQSGSHGSQ